MKWETKWHPRWTDVRQNCCCTSLLLLCYFTLISLPLVVSPLQTRMSCPAWMDWAGDDGTWPHHPPVLIVCLFFTSKHIDTKHVDMHKNKQTWKLNTTSNLRRYEGISSCLQMCFIMPDRSLSDLISFNRN